MPWKTLGGRCLKRTAQGACVFDNFFFRWLTLDSKALQTVLNKCNLQKPGLHYINALVFMAREKPGPSCMLGLGGAAIAHALSPYMKNFRICAVEQSDEIIELAAQYFMTDRIPNLDIIHEEASFFVKNSPQQFRHIMIDLFNAESFPVSCCNEAFFSDCKQLLVPGGFLAVNLANRDEQRPIFDMIRKHFSALVAIPVKKCANLVLIASENEQVMPLLDVFKRSKQLKNLTWDETWGCVAEFR